MDSMNYEKQESFQKPIGVGGKNSGGSLKSFITQRWDRLEMN